MVKFLNNLFSIVFIPLFFFISEINAASYTWTGAVDSNWNNSNNWSPVGIPSINDNVQLSTGLTTMPTLTSDVTITGMSVGNGFGNCGSSGLLPVIINMNNFKLTIGVVTSATSATGSLHIESCPASWFVGVNFVLSCPGISTNSSFVVNGIIYGANYGDLFNSDVDVFFNFYNNCNPSFRLRALKKDLRIECLYTTDGCMAFSGFGVNGTWSNIAPFGDPSQIIWYNSIDVCTVGGNFRFLNRTSKIVTPGWHGFTVYGNFYISNTGGGLIRTSERTRTTVFRINSGSLITLPPEETLPQNGDMYLIAIRQFGTLPGLVMDLTTCPGGCITTPTGNAMLNITTGTFSGPVFVKTPSASSRSLRWTSSITSIYDNTTVNNQFLNDFNLTKTGPQNDYFVGSNIYIGNVNIVNMGTGTMNFGASTSTYPQCNVAVCGSCSISQLFGNITGAPYYDSYVAGDTVRGNVQLTQTCGAGTINLMTNNKVNVYYKDIDLKISSNMSVSGTMSFNGPVGTAVGQSLTVDDLCSTNPILTMNKLMMFQASSSNNLDLIYNSSLSGHQKLMIVDSSTVLTTGKVNNGQVVVQLNGAYNGHIGSNSSYYIVNTIGGVRRTVPTSSATGYLFPTGTSSLYFPLSITGASTNALITVGMISGVNSLYTGSPAFVPAGIIVGDRFINSVWTVNSTATGLKAMLKGGWWDASAYLPSFDPTISARMITNDGNGWSCFAGTANGVAFGANPSWAYDYSVQSASSIPGIYSVVMDGVTVGSSQSLCGPLITLAGLSATAINSGVWSVVSAPSAVTFISTTTGITTIMGLNATGTYALIWSSSSYCGVSASGPLNIFKTGSGTISGFWQGNSQDWFACENWDNGIIPSITTNVTIPGGKLFYPNSSVSGFTGNLTTLIQITDLTIQNGGSMILTTSSGNPLELNGNLDVQTGGVLSVSSTDYVTMAGSTSLSSITGGGSISLGNFRINKTSGDVLLNNRINMQSGSYNLDMVKGILRSYETTSTGNNILVMNPGNAVASVSNTSYVDGWIRKTGNTSFVFPTGGANGYRAIEIAPSAGNLTDQFTAKYFQIDPASLWDKNSKDVTLDHVSRMEYWILDRTAGTTSATVSLYWNLYSDVSYSATDYTELRVTKWDGTMWTDLGNSMVYPSADRNYGWVKAGTMATSFSPFTLGTTIPANPLPLGLLSFNVKAITDGAKIDWILSDINNLISFEVERSADASDFQKIFTVKQENDKNSYSVIDENPLKGISYYRLKTIDANGKKDYSNMVTYRSFFTDNKLTFNVSPNPFNTRVKVLVSAQSDQINVIIFDLVGNQLFNRNYTAQNDISLELENLPSGIYNIKITTPSTSYTEKLIKL